MIQEYQIIIEKFLIREPIKKDMAPFMFRMANALPEAKTFHKNLFSMDGPLGVDPALVFTDADKLAQVK